MSSIQAPSIAVNLMGKAVELAAKWAATRRRNGLAAAAARPEDDKDREIVFLRDRVAELISQVAILRQLHKPDNTTRYTIREPRKQRENQTIQTMRTLPSAEIGRL